MKITINIILYTFLFFSLSDTFELCAQTNQQKMNSKLQGMQQELEQIQQELYHLQGQKDNYLYTPKKKQDINSVDISKIISEEETITDEIPQTDIQFPQRTASRYTRKWTLEECIAHALEHNITIQQLKVQRKVAEVQQSTAKNSRLPDLNAVMLHDWSFGRSQIYPDLDETMSRSAGGISSSLPLFTGFRIPNEISRAKLEFEAATQNLEKAKDNLSLNITSLFLQVLFNKELLKINEEQLILTRSQIRKTRILIEAGSVPPANLYDIQAQLAKDKVAVIEAKNNLELALLDLTQALEMENDTRFDVTTSFFNESALTEMFRSIQPAQLIYENAVSFKPLVKEQEFRVESAKKTLKVAQADYMPNLNLIFEFGTGYLYRYGAKDQINPVTNELIRGNKPFKTQLRNNDYTLVGFRLNIPVFNRFQTRNKVRTARLEIQNQQLELENTRKSLYKEIQTAYKNAVAAYEKYKASGDAVKSTAESFKHAEVRYELAKMTPFEYDEAKTRLVRSQAEQIQAKYDYILRTKILDFYNGIPIRL